MSYFSLTTFIEAGEKSLKEKNYWSALAVALSLPGMCSRVMYQEDKFGGTDRSGKEGYWHIDKHNKKNWHDKKCYVDFCKTIMQNDEWVVCVLGSQFAEIIYQLRCDIIHAGVADIIEDSKGIYLTLGENISSTDFSKYRIINVKDLCNALFSCVRTWCLNNSVDNFKYTFVFDVEKNSDDRILYNRLCENERADNLEKQFIKENNERLGK